MLDVLGEIRPPNFYNNFLRQFVSYSGADDLYNLLIQIPVGKQPKKNSNLKMLLAAHAKGKFISWILLTSFVFFVSAFLRDYSLCWDRWKWCMTPTIDAALLISSGSDVGHFCL